MSQLILCIHLFSVIARLRRVRLSPHAVLDQPLFGSNIYVKTPLVTRVLEPIQLPTPLCTDSRGFAVTSCTWSCPITHICTEFAVSDMNTEKPRTRPIQTPVHNKPAVLKKECTKIWTPITTKHHLPTVWHQRLITHFTLLNFTACLKYAGPLF